MLLSGADIIVRTLIEQGCDVVFGYPGGQIINVYDSLYKYSDELRHILTAHEQGASHAADGYASATGKPGVVIATSGPGATNLVTGIATAYIDSVPLVAAIVGAVFVGIGAGIVVRQGGACAGDDALALVISKKLKIKISKAYLFTDITVLLLSLTYIPFRQIAYSLVTVLLSGWIIEKVQNWKKKDSVGAVLS